MDGESKIEKKKRPSRIRQLSPAEKAKAYSELGLTGALEEKQSQFKKHPACWENIQAVGELKLLTRASYFFLLFVPLLSGSWPLVAKYINYPYLPHSWSLSFFAALLITIGHVIYESSAPKNIKRITAEDYAIERAKNSAALTKQQSSKEQFGAAWNEYQRYSHSKKSLDTEQDYCTC